MNRVFQYVADKCNGKPEGVRSSLWDSTQRATVKSTPWCAWCGVMKKLQVHHKKPFHLHPELELDRGNLIVLCAKCHFTVGHLCSWFKFNPFVDKDCACHHKEMDSLEIKP